MKIKLKLVRDSHNSISDEELELERGSGKIWFALEDRSFSVDASELQAALSALEEVNKE